jgi:hypothetical protein
MSTGSTTSGSNDQPVTRRALSPTRAVSSAPSGVEVNVIVLQPMPFHGAPAPTPMA